jgi:hypothetical protein
VHIILDDEVKFGMVVDYNPYYTPEDAQNKAVPSYIVTVLHNMYNQLMKQSSS